MAPIPIPLTKCDTSNIGHSLGVVRAGHRVDTEHIRAALNALHRALGFAHKLCTFKSTANNNRKRDDTIG